MLQQEAYLPNFIKSDHMKPNCAIYDLHIRQGQSLADQDLMKFLNLINNLQCFIGSGTRSHILGAKYLID